MCCNKGVRALKPSRERKHSEQTTTAKETRTQNLGYIEASMQKNLNEGKTIGLGSSKVVDLVAVSVVETKLQHVIKRRKQKLNVIKKQGHKGRNVKPTWNGP